jgi:glycosyltransferase involved in cell wall biosynthesis
MKIGIMGTRGIPNQYGGFEQFAQQLSVGLVQRGHKVYVYNSSRHPYQHAEWNSVKIIHCNDPEHRIGTAGQFLYDRNCIKDANKRNYDVLFHLGYTSDSVWWRNWPKNTLNIMNMDGLEWKREKYNSLTRVFLKKAEAMAARHADLLIADSPAIKEYLFKTYNRQASFIPYSAKIFEAANPACLESFQILPGTYSLLIARMEPENNIETVIKGYMHAGLAEPLVVVGRMDNAFAKRLLQQYQLHQIKFVGAIYDASILNQLRYFSRFYFHGHSVGGTNPSLLEAMACNCTIIAHENPFNRAVLGEDAIYFNSAESIEMILKGSYQQGQFDDFKSRNAEKISTVYHPGKILDAYEQLAITVLST